MSKNETSGHSDDETWALPAMQAVQRHEFVPDEYRCDAYEDRALPIGFDQTISQPWIVARMTGLLDVQPGDKILEIGTGSGYQSAVLAEMGAEVYSIELIPELLERAREAHAKAGYEVHTRVGNGYFGWVEHAPYDGIIVTAAPDHVPPALRDQLGPEGKMVIPVGAPGEVQVLWLIERRDGRWISGNYGDVRFVPFVHAG